MGYVNAPITDNLAFNFSAFANKQENYYTNVAGPVWPIWSYGGRLKLRWDITDHLSNTFTGSYQQVSDNAGLSFDETRVAPVFALDFPADPYSPKERKLDMVDFDAGAMLHNQLLADTIDWKMPWVETKLIGSIQRTKDADFVQTTFRHRAAADIAGSGSPVLPIRTPPSCSSCRRRTRRSATRFTWVGGLFYIYSTGGWPVHSTSSPRRT